MKTLSKNVLSIALNENWIYSSPSIGVVILTAPNGEKYASTQKQYESMLSKEGLLNVAHNLR